MGSAPDPVVVIPDGTPPEVAENAERLATLLHQLVATQLEDAKLTAPTTTVIFATELWPEITRRTEALGMRPDPKSGVERLGGVVAGKTLHSDADDRFDIVVDAALLSSDHLDTWDMTAVLAHEFMHIRYGIERRANLGPLPFVSAPWDIAAVAAQQAAEEYRVEQLAHAVVDLIAPATRDGMPLPYREWREPAMLASVPAIASSLQDGCLSAITHYRVRGGSDLLSAMWASVAALSVEAMMSLAYVQACLPADRLVWDVAPVSAGVPLTRLACHPLFEYLGESALIPAGADTWAQDSSRIVEAGQRGWREAWKALGVTATPMGDDFFLHVSDHQLPDV